MMKNPRNLSIFAGLGGIVGFVFGLSLAVVSGNTRGAEDDIRVVLDRQVEDWNSGDIDAYMQGYVKGDGLRFASGGNIEAGWQSTLDRYLKRYPDRSAMGRLETENLDIQVID